MKNVKISLVVPVYNVEKYLCECIDSCLNQTLNDIEVLCVNDCSQDTSLSILEAYAKKDSRLKIINHEKNKGLGAARNTGVSNATGEYIWFIDSDDFIDVNACKVLYDIAALNNLEILRFCGVTFQDDGDKHDYIGGFYDSVWKKDYVINFKEFQKTIPLDFTVSACMYIAKRDFLSKFLFREGVYYEDTDFTPILFSNAEKLMCLSYSAYHRRVTPGSITQQSISQKHILDRLLVLKTLEQYIRKNCLSKNSYVYRFFISYISFVLDNSKMYKKSWSEEISCLYTHFKRKEMNNRIERKIKLLIKCVIPYGIIVAEKRFFRKY